MHKLTLSRRTPAALAACALILPAALQAQTDVAAPVTNIPPIIVQASRTGRTASEMPANVRVITADEITRSGNSTIVDVLEKQAGIHIRELSGNPATAQVSLRGFGANSFGRVLILVNGERLNNPDMSSPNLLRIPVQSVSRIEVIRGTQTVLNGDFAEAGVINIITADPDAEPRTTVAASAGSYDTYGTHLSKSGTFEDGVSYFASADWNKSGGYRENSDYETYDLNAAVTKRWDEARYLSLSAFYNDSTYGMPGSLTWKQFKSNPRQSATPKDSSDLQSYGGNLGAGAPLGADGKLEANLTASRRETDSKWFGSGFRSAMASDIDSYGFTPRYTLEGDLLHHENRLIVGSDLRYDRSSTDLRGVSWSSWGVFPYASVWDYDRSSAAGYAQDEFFLTETLSLLLGARAEKFFSRVDSGHKTESFSDSQYAYDAALLYRPLEDLKLFTRAARYYRAPFVDEVVGFGGVPNPDLDPETGFSLEAGVEATLAKEWTAGVTVYQMDSQDEIYYHIDSTGLGQNMNAPDSTRRQGAETSLRWARDEVGSATLSYDYVHAVFAEGEYDENTFPLVPRQTVSLSGEACVTHEVALLGGVRYVSSQYLDTDFANKQDQLKAYGLLDLAVRYEPAYLKGLRLLAGVDNVLDKEYASYAGYSSWSGPYYYPANARTWKVCASYTF